MFIYELEDRGGASFRIKTNLVILIQDDISQALHCKQSESRFQDTSLDAVISLYCTYDDQTAKARIGSIFPTLFSRLGGFIYSGWKGWRRWG